MITTATVTLSAFATLAAAVSSIASLFAARHAERQLEIAERSTEAEVFLQIDERWRDIYPIYRQLAAESVDMSVLTQFPDRDALMASDFWQERRPVFAFYEFVGSCVEAGLLRRETVLKLVNINPALWTQYAPMIKAMRKMPPVDYPDLYIRWQGLAEPLIAPKT
ncbi:MAG: hypothetical protein AAGH87_04225 [Pseudomonadota bacterium]